MIDSEQPQLGAVAPPGSDMDLQKENNELRRRLASAEYALRQKADVDAALLESESRLRTVLEGVGEPFYALDRHWRFLFASRAALRIWGKSARDVLGRAFLDVFPQSDGSAAYQAHVRVAQTGTPERLETISSVLNRWVAIDLAPTPQGLSVAFRDIDDRKRTEAALRESEGRLSLAIDIGAMASWDWDLPSGEVTWNARHFLLQGYAVGEVKPSFDAWLVRVHPDDREETVALIEKARDERLNYVHDFRSLHADGQIVWCSARGRFFYDAQGRPLRMIGVMTDVTEQKRAEAALRDSEARQAFLLKLSDAFRPLQNAVDIERTAVEALGKQLGASAVFFATIADDGESWSVRHAFADGPPRIAGSFPMTDFQRRRLAEWRAGHVASIADSETDPALSAADRDAYAAFRARAAIGIPLVRGERFAALLAVNQSEPRHWNEGEVALARETAERTWAAMERARAEAALRDSEQRFRALVTAGSYSIFRMSPDWRRMYQLESTTLAPTSEPIEGWIEKYIPCEALPEVNAAVSEAIASRSLFELEHRVKAADGAEAWVLSRAVPILAPDGEILEWFGTGADVTVRRRAEEALRESEERFRQFAEASAGGLWIRNAQTLAMEYGSPAVWRVYGAERDSFLGDIKHWAALIVPEDRATAFEHMERARSGQAVVHEFRIQRSNDHVFRWIRNTDFPLLDRDGRVERVGGIAEDVTESKLAMQHQGVLLAELQHRVRNIMAMIRSMALRSADGAPNVDDYRSSLEGRLLALARVQVLLTHEANAGGWLRTIIESEVGAQAHQAGQFELFGPDVRLSPKAVEVLTLAMHELATNALKYGALSVPDGRLRVEWARFDKRGRAWLAIDWTESGAPPRGGVPRRGFGSDLIEGRIPYELGGTGKIVFGPDGARCHLDFPLQDGESILETDAPIPATIFGGSLDMSGAPDLAGRKVLVVEDDYYIAGDTAAALRGAGADVLGPCPTEEATLDLLESETPTHAVLDLNLGGGGPRFEIAHPLKERGVPFIFLTGYDAEAIPTDLAEIMRLQKPVTFRAIVEAVARL